MVTNTAISIHLRKRFIKAYVLSTLTYGYEAWTINKEMEKKIEAADMWFYKRRLKVSWTERISNEQVLNRAGGEREMMRMIRRRQLRFLGHVMRRQELESICMPGRLHGRRGRGRPRMKLWIPWHLVPGRIRHLGKVRLCSSIWNENLQVLPFALYRQWN